MHSTRLRPYIHEKDLHSFLQPKKTWQQQYRSAIGATFVVVLLGMGYAVVSLPSFLRSSGSQVAAQPVVTKVTEVVATVQPSTAPTPTPLPPPTIPENTLAIPELSIAAPTIWNVAFEEKQLNKALESGVVHLAGTPLPGQQGYSVLFGHSSNYPWAAGSYKTIFAPLTKAVVGQEFSVNYSNIEYRYRVTKTYEVMPTQMEVLKSPAGTNGMRLITCTPLGTSLRRLVIEADQITPNPSTNTPSAESTFAQGSLPADK